MRVVNGLPYSLGRVILPRALDVEFYRTKLNLSRNFYFTGVGFNLNINHCKRKNKARKNMQE